MSNLSANEKKVPDRKRALLLCPEHLGHRWDVVKLLFIDKTTAGIQLKNEPFTASHILNDFAKLPDEARRLMNRLTSEKVDEEMEKADLAYTKLRTDISFEEHSKRLSIKYFYDIFFSLKPYFPLIKFYSQSLKSNGNYFTATVRFSAFKPTLSFSLKKLKDGFYIETIVQIDDVTASLTDFKRSHFLLESNHEFFLLALKDYRTLEWMGDQKYITKSESNVKQTLVTLEQDYKVDRNNVFHKKNISAQPVNRIFLSELNNAFLMLTPQWLYEGIMVEGAYKPYFDTIAGGDEICIERNKEAEQHLINTIVALHPNFANQRNGYYYVSFADAQKKQWFLKTYHNLLQQEIELTGMDMLNHFRYSPDKIETKHSIESNEGNKLMINMEVSFGKEKLHMGELQKMILAGQKAVLLKDGSLGILNDEWMQQYGTLIRHGKMSKDGVEVSKFIALTLNHTSEERAIFTSVVREEWWAKWLQWQTADTPVYAVPATIKATLRPYQQKGFEWLTLLSEIGAGGCLADDMGLGKTLQTITFLVRYHEEKQGQFHLIVAPSSLLYNWQNELQKFAPHLNTIVHHGAARNADTLFEGNYHVIITSYGTLRSDAAVLLAAQYGLAVIDESHNIKNPAAQITNVVQQLNAQVRVALSGTPVVNNTFDLYSQLTFSVPGMFGSREFFKREYADAIDRFQDEDKIKALQKLTGPFILRRTKEQVAPDLPEKTESILWCKMSREQQDLYNEIQEQVKGNVFTDIKTNGFSKSKFAVMQGIMKLRQICNSPMLLPEDERDNATKSVKTEVLLAELSNILKGHKALVFSQFASMLHLLSAECTKQGIDHFHFDGQTPIARRAEMVKEFQQEDCKTNLFLISLKAGNTGLTLTAAEYVFLFDPYWNRATEQQAIDRTHRIGQQKSVFAYKIICKNTIEEKIIHLQNRKQKIADELVGEDDGFIKSLTEEDLQFLFS